MSDYSFKIIGIDHIGIATNDNSLSNFLSDILMIEDVSVEEVKNQEVVTKIYNTGNGKLELLKPTSDKSPISKFLNIKGQSVHHIALCVDNLNNAIKYLKSIEVRLINDKPSIGAEGYSVVFIHPHESPGILIELCQKNK